MRVSLLPYLFIFTFSFYFLHSKMSHIKAKIFRVVASAWFQSYERLYHTKLITIHLIKSNTKTMMPIKLKLEPWYHRAIPDDVYVPYTCTVRCTIKMYKHVKRKKDTLFLCIYIITSRQWTLLLPPDSIRCSKISAIYRLFYVKKSSGQCI